MAEAKVTESEIIKTVTRPDNPRGGTDFLTKQPKKNVLPNLFKILHGDGPIQDKVAAIGNVRRALEEPDKSELADNIIETTLDEFISKVIVDGSKVASMTPSPQAQEALKAIKSNFGFAMENNRISTLTGRNVEILIQGVNPQLLLEAVAGGIFSKTESPEFKQVLFKTFLRLSENPHFQDRVLLKRDGHFGFDEPRAKNTGEEKRKEAGKADKKPGEKTPNEIRLENALMLTQQELMKANINLEGRVRQVLRQQGDIRELQKQLDEMRRGSTSRESFVPQIPKEWSKVLDIIPSAIPERIISHIRTRRRLFHPDTVLAPLEAAGVSRDSTIYKGLKALATGWTVAINNAEDEVKTLGLIPETNGGK